MMFMSETAVINIRLPEEVTRILDELVDKKLFTSRSEAIREFLREYVMQEVSR